MSSGKRVITIVGGGQSGLQLGNGLLSAGYDVRLVQDRKGDDIRNGKVMSSQCMFDKALSYEREIGTEFLGQGMPDGRVRSASSFLRPMDRVTRRSSGTACSTSRRKRSISG